MCVTLGLCAEQRAYSDSGGFGVQNISVHPSLSPVEGKIDCYDAC